MDIFVWYLSLVGVRTGIGAVWVVDWVESGGGYPQAGQWKYRCDECVAAAGPEMGADLFFSGYLQGLDSGVAGTVLSLGYRTS